MVINKPIYNGELVSIGQFFCPPSLPNFHDTGPIDGYLLVFPRTSVQITHAGQSPIVADPNVVMFYNQGQEYRRDKLSERGDVCDWVAFQPQTLIETITPYDPTVQARWEKPFRFTHSSTTADIYFQQRQLVRRLITDEAPDTLQLEETLLHLLDSLMAWHYSTAVRTCHRHDGSRTHHGDLVHEAQAILSTRFQEKLTLSDLAAELYTSPYHLCRLFRRYTGQTIHHYLSQLRLRTALEYLHEPNFDLTTLALTLGYASHSHFTQAFRRAFGIVPSKLKQL